LKPSTARPFVDRPHVDLERQLAGTPCSRRNSIDSPWTPNASGGISTIGEPSALRQPSGLDVRRIVRFRVQIGVGQHAGERGHARLAGLIRARGDLLAVRSDIVMPEQAGALGVDDDVAWIVSHAGNLPLV
jgi:hypothetical protein